jgi:alginate O-acetyltransferase complex protein AlgI
MIMPSLLYGLFLLSVAGIYWSLPQRRSRLWILLLASLVFYGSLQVGYVPLMVAIALSTYLMGQAMTMPLDWRIANDQWRFAERGWNRRRRILLIVGISLNTLLLLGFKYLDFGFRLIFGSSEAIPAAVGGSLWADLIVPLGISFFVFECIAYLVDVYRGSPASPNFTEFAAYKFFFPKLISGPITRFHNFNSQLETDNPPQLDQWVEGLWLIAIGSVKKLLIADNLAVFINLSFSNMERAGSVDLWLTVFAYGLQLYLDFSAYVDIARGSALLLGIKLPHNFNFPYLCTSIADFWRRWHMTLGAWLRNYLYFPLGGSRKGLARTCLNLMIIMVIAGIWHGDNWGFLIWGALHGVALVVHRLTHAASQKWALLGWWWQTLPGTLLAWGLTQAMVFTSWIFFRLPNWSEASFVVQRLWGYGGDVQFLDNVYFESLGIGRLPLFGVLLILMGGMGIAYSFQRGLRLQLSWPLKLMLMPLFAYLSWLLAPADSLPYIYFDF